MNGVIIGSLVSEKSSTAQARGRYTFFVNSQVNKIQVKQYFKSVFGLMVKDVNLLNRVGKSRRVGRILGTTRPRKIAVVSFASGQSLEAIEKMF